MALMIGIIGIDDIPGYWLISIIFRTEGRCILKKGELSLNIPVSRADKWLSVRSVHPICQWVNTDETAEW